MTIRDEALEIVCEHGEYHAISGGDGMYCVRYNGNFLVDTDTSALTDKLAKVMLSERLKKD